MKKSDDQADSVMDDLAEYKRKRDFAITTEPAGDDHKTGKRRIYVIQKHAARRLHYDLRLELGGTLKSWAIPKGPSLDPKEKRLAVHVEDHPIEYADFEGTIPEGEYGAGTVMIWDRGYWEPLEADAERAYQSGTLKFALFGQKLRGKWTLVQMKGKASDEGKNWLLIKERDSEAKPESQYDVIESNPLSAATGRDLDEIAKNAPPKAAITQSLDLLPGAMKSDLPKSIKPELATAVNKVPEGDEWLHEIKYDGYRILAVLKDGEARLYSRNELDWTDRFSTIARELEKLPAANAILDGEVVALRPDGRTDFQALQNYLKEGQTTPIRFYVFDLPYYDNYSLVETPLIERKRLLKRVLESCPVTGLVKFSEHVVGNGNAYFTRVNELGLEGVVSKRIDSKYRQRRTRDWVKVKCTKRQEFVVGGYTEPGGTRIGFGALLLGCYEGDRLIYAGRVGTGFDDKTLQELSARMKHIETNASPFAEALSAALTKGVHWVQPKLVVEVAFAEWTNDHILRHASFIGLREDKQPREVSCERRLGNIQNVNKSADLYGIISRSDSTVAGIVITHPNRAVFPDYNITKFDIAEYYALIADWILPHIAARPLTVVRVPEGKTEKRFYQKHVTDSLPDYIRGIEIESDDGVSQYIVLDDLKGLITMVQLGAMEFHPWGSLASDLDHPDRMIFDLDPGPGVKWRDVIETASYMRDFLEALGLVSFAKTTGGKGMHVVVPLMPRHSWHDVKGFARAVAERFAQVAPTRYTAIMSKSKRQNRIYVDYLRNSRGATAVAAYSTRAREGAPVSTPLSWDELSFERDSSYYTIKNVPSRLSRLKADPWGGFFDVEQDLDKAMRSIG